MEQLHNITTTKSEYSVVFIVGQDSDKDDKNKLKESNIYMFNIQFLHAQSLKMECFKF